MLKYLDNKLDYEEYFKLSFKERVLYHITVESTRPLSDKEKLVQNQFDDFINDCRIRFKKNERVF